MHNLRRSQLAGRSRLSALQAGHQETAEQMAAERDRFATLADPISRPAVFSSFNLFPTPPALALRLVDLANIKAGHKVLEPSAGTGNLLRAIASRFDDPYARHIEVTAVEIDGPLWHHLSDSDFALWTVARNADFLTWTPPHQFDRVIMNPPFKQGRDIKHIQHAATMLAPFGRLVAICANGPRQREALEPLASEWHELPAGSFKGEGTNVNAAIVVIDA